MFKLLINGKTTMMVVGGQRPTRLLFPSREDLESFLTVVLFMSDIRINELLDIGRAAIGTSTIVLIKEGDNDVDRIIN